jgi:hypothetical protein
MTSAPPNINGIASSCTADGKLIKTNENENKNK